MQEPSVHTVGPLAFVIGEPQMEKSGTQEGNQPGPAGESEVVEHNGEGESYPYPGLYLCRDQHEGDLDPYGEISPVAFLDLQQDGLAWQDVYRQKISIVKLTLPV